MQPIRVEVEYALTEYKNIVREFLPLAKKNKPQVNRKLPWNSPWFEEAVFAAILAPIFFIKKLRVGICTFEFTESGFTRTSKGYEASRSWEQVAAVHRLKEAYLIELSEGGAVPVPYRVFTQAERDALESVLPAGERTSPPNNSLKRRADGVAPRSSS